MVVLLVLLLIALFAAFFGLDQFIHAAGIATNNSDILLTTINNYQVSLSIASVRTVLGVGIVFLELLIIIMSVFGRILDTLRATIRPIVTLIPLAGFLVSVYNTFRPIVESLLPGGDATYIAQAVNDTGFTQSLTQTFGLMLLFLLVTVILGGESGEVRRLKAELRKYQKSQKS